jgi:hypothetical protein
MGASIFFTVAMIRAFLVINICNHGEHYETPCVIALHNKIGALYLNFFRVYQSDSEECSKVFPAFTSQKTLHTIYKEQQDNNVEGELNSVASCLDYIVTVIDERMSVEN